MSERGTVTFEEWLAITRERLAAMRARAEARGAARACGADSP